MKLTFASLVPPHLQLGMTNWVCELYRISKRQKQALQNITNSRYNVHIIPLFALLHLLKVINIFDAQRLKLWNITEVLNNKLPNYFLATRAQMEWLTTPGPWGQRSCQLLGQTTSQAPGQFSSHPLGRQCSQCRRQWPATRRQWNSGEKDQKLVMPGEEMKWMTTAMYLHSWPLRTEKLSIAWASHFPSPRSMIFRPARTPILTTVTNN